MDRTFNRSETAADTILDMSGYRSSFPVLDPAAASNAEAGQIKITPDLVDRGLDRALQEKNARGETNGTKRLVAKPLDPLTARISS